MPSQYEKRRPGVAYTARLCYYSDVISESTALKLRDNILQKSFCLSLRLTSQRAFINLIKLIPPANTCAFAYSWDLYSNNTEGNFHQNCNVEI
jgi:hypothetical protein